ncbi:alcohol dehydrogenase catalytic domain-containing protein [Paenibacillus sp. LMG 31460]|uniref:Alcohol dehydrogenase catalytic domain-containing protein n=1 Tax=Paenibacillus germinis TaxID=2654979 RepID=A0ABX1Z7K6_9BACL|nr:alcohol dehydrogenase catalytic domain-containing protein [Paenibacillus germinis]NOU88264.1 alcohol dehydrogenase catalytic domain-containing protein [Paenibacillus germinis]
MGRWFASKSYLSFPFHYPRILGHELSGVIEHIGNYVEGLAVGDRVAIFRIVL